MHQTEPPARIVFTDLDGSLLDHDHYEWRPAETALGRLAQLQIPVIPVTSKTCAEVKTMLAGLNIHHPFIVENGAGVVFPQNSPLIPFIGSAMVGKRQGNFLMISLEPRHNEINRQLAMCRRSYQFSRFSDLSLQRISELTGLSEDEAKRATTRDFSQPLHWEDTDQALLEFAAALNKLGFSVVKGGRFLHVLGEANKGNSVRWLTGLFEKFWGTPIPTIALGDGGNDVPMLEVADFPVLIASKAPPAVEHIRNIRYTASYGPEGWNEAMHALLEELVPGDEVEN